MNTSIRKLYNVLVVGGALAAATGCNKPAGKAQVPKPVATAEPAPAAAPEPAPAPAPAPAPEAGGVRGWGF